MSLFKYFGPDKFRKDYETRIDTPVGKVCFRCDEPITEGDIGTVNNSDQVEHYECLMRAIVGSVGHQNGLCSCFGGTEEDPPGLTRRQAAIAAARLWDEQHSY
jgi:hypothetical protein